jgi:hypothetical protein
MLAIVFWGSNKHWQKCRSRIQKEDSWGFDGVITYLWLIEYLEGKKSKNIPKHGEAGAAAGLHHPIILDIDFYMRSFGNHITI